MRTALYRFFDETGSLLYVGITNDLHHRWDSHAEEKFWWHLATRIEVIWHGSREAADEAERLAIRTENPIYNRTLNKGKIPVREGQRMPDPFLDRCVETLREGITSGRYPDGFVFTGDLETALDMNVSPTTFLMAMHQLRDEGLISVGPYIRTRKKRARSFVVGEGAPAPTRPIPSLPTLRTIPSPRAPWPLVNRGFGALDPE